MESNGPVQADLVEYVPLLSTLLVLNESVTVASWLATKTFTVSTCQMWCSCVRPSVNITARLLDKALVLYYCFKIPGLH